MAKIDLVDISIRDGNQSLWGATGLNTAQIVEIAPVMDRVGYRAIDFNSSTHMAVAVRYAKEDPWERIRLTHAAAPNTPLQYITTGFRFIAWETAQPDFMRLVYRKIAEAGIGRVIILDPMHDLDGFLTGARMMKEEGIGDVMAALTYTISDVHDDAFYAGLAREFAKCPHIDRAYIKDPAGILLPERARTLVPAVLKAIAPKPLEIHSHCTIGLAPLTYMVAAEAGIGLRACGRGRAGERHVAAPGFAHRGQSARDGPHGRYRRPRAGIVESYFTRLADAEGLPHGTVQEFDAAYLRHQMPGGAITTMHRQLREIGQEHRLAEVMEEIPRVRAELGYPIMVTPFPQIVSTQAMMNVTGAGRYDTVSDQVIRYVLEKFGHPTAPVDREHQGQDPEPPARPRADE